MKQRGFWLCRRCHYQEPVSQYKQSPRRYCPKCFAVNRERIPLIKKEVKPLFPTRPAEAGPGK